MQKGPLINRQQAKFDKSLRTQLPEASGSCS